MQKYKIEIEIPEIVYLPIVNKNLVNLPSKTFDVIDMIEGEDFYVVELLPYNIDVDGNLEMVLVDSLPKKQNAPDWLDISDFSYIGIPGHMLYMERTNSIRPDKYNSQWFYEFCEYKTM